LKKLFGNPNGSESERNGCKMRIEKNHTQTMWDARRKAAREEQKRAVKEAVFLFVVFWIGIFATVLYLTERFLIK
jgi:hypothetical protein